MHDSGSETAKEIAVAKTVQNDSFARKTDFVIVSTITCTGYISSGSKTSNNLRRVYSATDETVG
jgi:hypothetical protein